MPDFESRWEHLLKWIWDNWDEIERRLGRLRKWFRGSPQKRGILVVGAGGTGKTTLASLLADENRGGDIGSLRDYRESIAVERFTLTDDPDVEIVVPPGQKHRRDATWGDLEAELKAGAFRGVIVVSSYGFHSIGISYRQHHAYRGDKRRFLNDFTRLRRDEELAILERLSSAVVACPRRLWMLSVVTKQDLWWDKRRRVDRFYANDDTEPYASRLNAIAAAKRSDGFRHEVVFCSLALHNFVTGKDELLAKTVAGYDQQMQLMSLRHLFEAVYGLMEWETKG